MKIIERRIKTIIFFLLIILVISGALIFMLRPLRTSLLGQKQIVYIAAVGPLSGSTRTSGEAMQKGIQLYVDRVNRDDLLEGKTLRLLPMLNDQDNSRFAMQRAADIALQHKALLVLGHLSSAPSLAASEIYQKHGIPAITASATGDEITRNNPWYFRVIPNNSFQGAFLAHWVKNILQQDSTSIISDKDAYGSSLAQSYEYTAEKLLGMKIKEKWELDLEAGDLDHQVKKITAELRALEDPGAIFFATHEREAVKIITSIKLPGTSYTIIGPDSFTTRPFIREFQQYSQEQAQPGYYSDGIYAASLFIAELADNKAQEFKAAFEAKYQEEPTWEAACYYDAVAVAVEAIKRAEIDGTNLRDDRRKVREALANLSNPDVAVPGIAGNIYFNQSNEIRRPLAIGQYYKQQLLPAYAQYQTLQDEGMEEIQVEDLRMTKTQIVKVGVDLNNIGNFDLRNSTYTLDFYVWFRFQGAFHDNAITFPDAITPISLETPFFKEQVPLTLRAYHIKADFKGDFKFNNYPFDRFFLPIKFYHKTEPITRLRYVPDLPGLSSPMDTKKTETLFNPITEWKVEKIAHVVNTTSSAPNLSEGESAEISSYSEFITYVQMARENIGFAIKSFIPLIILAMIVYLTYYIPIQRIGVRVSVFISVLLVNTLYEYMLRSHFPTNDFLAIEVAVVTIYGLTALAAIVSVGGYILHERHHSIFFLMTLAGRILHPVLVFLVGVGFVVFYMILSEFAFTP